MGQDYLQNKSVTDVKGVYDTPSSKPSTVKSNNGSKSASIFTGNKKDTPVQEGTAPQNVEFDKNGYPKIIVQNGETPESLAKKFGCSPQDIINANPKAWNGKWFNVGTKITIPKVISPDSKALQGRKSKSEAEAEWVASKAKHSKNTPSASKPKSTTPSSPAKRGTSKQTVSPELDKNLREKLGLINYNGRGETITSKSGKTYTVIGQANNARKIVQDAQGNIKVMSHDKQILKQDYVLNSNDFEKQEKVTAKMRNKDGTLVDRQFVKVKDLDNGRELVKDKTGKTYIKSGDTIITDSYAKTHTTPKKADNPTKTQDTAPAQNTPQTTQTPQSGKDIAQSLVDDIFGLGTGKEISGHIKNINSSNVTDVLNNYKSMSDKKAFGKGETLMDGILGENISDSDKKRYINHIKDALVQRANELGGDATSIGETLKNEINYALVSSWPMQDASALNNAINKFNNRISQLEKMNKKSSDVSADKAARGEQVYAGDGSDKYGNGQLDGNAVQMTGNCWAHAGLNAMRATARGREILANSIVKKDGVTTVYLAGAKKLGLPKPNGDGLYSYSEKDLQAGMKTLSSGDGDYTAVMMALEDYRRQSTAVDGSAVSLRSETQSLTGKGGTVGEVIKIMTGNEWESQNSGIPTYSDLKSAFDSGNVSIDFAVGHGKGEMYYTGTIQNGKVQRNIGAVIGSGEGETGGHAVAVTGMTDDFVYAVESNKPDTTLVIPREEFMKHVVNLNMWNLKTNTGKVYMA